MDEAGTIRQITDGQSLPVTHGRTPLTATAPRMGRRLAALIALRDQARQVLTGAERGLARDAAPGRPPRAQPPL